MHHRPAENRRFVGQDIVRGQVKGSLIVTDLNKTPAWNAEF